MTELAGVRLALGGRQVLDGISLTLAPRTVTVVRGGNGSGKSTLLGVAAGLVRPDAGTVTGGADGASTAYLPERFRPPGAVSANSYLAWVARARGVRGRRAVSEAVDDLCDRLDVEGVRSGALRGLSKGNLQKIGLAQALLGEPDRLFLDEPLSGLDARAQVAVAELIGEAAERGACVLVAHHGAAVFAGATTMTLAAGKLSDAAAEPPGPASGSGADVESVFLLRVTNPVGVESQVTCREADLASTVQRMLRDGWTITGVQGGSGAC